MAIKFTNITPSDLPDSVMNFDFVFTDLASSLAKTIALRKIGLLKTGERDESDTRSYLGTPVYDTMTLGDISSKDTNNYTNLLGETVSYTPIRLINCLLDVTQTKNIVSTPIQGRDGAIKEFISKGDYLITAICVVSGLYDSLTDNWISSSNKFPLSEMQTISGICDVNASIPISSSFLNEIFKINNVVITDYHFYQREGKRNEQIFELTMLSDRETILEFTEEEVDDNEYLNNILGA